MAAVPQHMSGIVIDRTGGPEVLQWKTGLPVPEPGEGQVLVKNEYSTVNFIDIYFRTGTYPMALPKIIGSDGSGTIVKLHPSVTGFSVGQHVAYLLDDKGSYAEYTVVTVSCRLAPVPDGLDMQTAAAVLTQGLSALTFIREAGGLPAHGGSSNPKWALVQAAAGGTGSLMVQILKNATEGVKVIATAGSADKVALAKQLGADHVLNSREDDVVAGVNDITGGHGADVVLDGVGKATFEDDLQLIASNGRLVSFGNASGVVPPFDILRLRAKNMSILRPFVFGYVNQPEAWHAYTTELFDLVASGKIKLNIHKVYDLKDAAQAHRDLESRKTTGKLLLKI